MPSRCSLVRIAFGFGALLGAELAFAIPVTYHFSTGPIVSTVTITPPGPSSPHAALLEAWEGLTVSGSFLYDNEAPAIGTGGIGLIQNRTVYGAISNISGSVGGMTFSDPSGSVSVANEGFILPPSTNVPPSDFFELSLEAVAGVPFPTGGGDLSGFSLPSFGLTLRNIRMTWIENTVGPIPDFLASNELPAVLPPSTMGSLIVDLVSTGPTASFTFATFRDLQVAPVEVTEPGTLALMALASLALLRRRSAKKHPSA